jgi:UDP-N-acetylmuramoyl-tripeptide--D-alanyl-D-alanine ligase
MIASMSLQQLKDVVGGELHGSASFQAVSTDTRSLRAGDLFVALQGPNFDGNQFIAQAKEKGACAALVSATATGELPTLTVADTRIALGRLGAWNRKQARAKVLALTGSQGKTTVKEMTAAILALRGSVLYTQGNLNNDIGAPLTLLQINAEHDFAVIELGANHKGEIAYTTALTQPDIALINNVAATHVEGFGSLQGVAEGKSELWQGLGSKGIAIVNLDDANVVARVPAGLRQVGISAAGAAKASYRVSAVQDKGLAGSRFMLHTPVGSHAVEIHVPGLHNVGNALAAAAMALEAGASLQNVVQGLGSAHAAKGRMNILKGRRGAVIIDDSYNASPSSFHAAIDVLAALPGVRIVVAGDMGELGDGKEQAHRALGDYAARKGIDHFFGTGVLTAQAVTAFGSKGVHMVDRGDLAERLLELLAPDTTVLVKGSRSAGMERVVKQLTELED